MNNMKVYATCVHSYLVEVDERDKEIIQPV